MTLRGIRITQTQFVPTAFDGEGARLYGGRWNSAGTRLVYLASSLSLATLELLVHIEDVSTIIGNYSYVEVEFDSSLVAKLERSRLPSNWDAPVTQPATQLLGDAWVQAGSSAILEVPSAVTPSEANYLMNPLHRDFAQIRIGSPVEFRVDPRLR